MSLGGGSTYGDAKTGRYVIRDIDERSEIPLGSGISLLPSTHTLSYSGHARRSHHLGGMRAGARILDEIRDTKDPIPLSGKGSGGGGGGIGLEIGAKDGSGGGLPKRKRTDIMDMLLRPRPAVGGVYHSIGRHSATSQEGIIDKVISMDRDLWEWRSRVPADEAVAPLGEKGDMKVLPGEWLLSYVDAPGMVSGGTVGIADVNVFSCVNGLSMFARVRFAGIALTVNDAGAENKDDHSTAAVAGKVTGINTGSQDAKAGDLLVIVKEPITWTDPSTSRIFSRIQQPGIPPTKFRPATYPLREGNVDRAIVKIQGIVNVIYITADKNDMPAASATLAEKFKVLEDTHKKAESAVLDENVGSLRVSPEIPLLTYGQWYSLSKRLQRFQRIVAFAIGGADDDEKRRELAGEAKAEFDSMYELVKTLVEKTAYGTAVSTIDSIISDGESELSDLLGSALGTGKDNGFAMEMFIDAQLSNLICEQHNFLRTMTVGLVLSNAGPGEQMDVLLGYHH